MQHFSLIRHHNKCYIKMNRLWSYWFYLFSGHFWFTPSSSTKRKTKVIKTCAYARIRLIMSKKCWESKLTRFQRCASNRPKISFRLKWGNERVVCLQESVSWNFRQEFTTTLGIVYFTTDMAYAIAYNQIPHVQRHVVTDYLFKYILRDFHGWSFVLHNHLRLQ